MAQALDSAQQVYGYRVDKVHQHAQDTRVVIVNGEDVKPSHDQGMTVPPFNIRIFLDVSFPAEMECLSAP